jgi:hypothetical protein
MLDVADHTQGWAFSDLAASRHDKLCFAHGWSAPFIVQAFVAQLLAFASAAEEGQSVCRMKAMQAADGKPA